MRVCEHMFVRWSNLIQDAADQQSLPGYRDGAVVRRFDAPEALDMRFYEVRARSALNRVPGRSRVPFRWTINPYRGCSHACTYCAWGGTPILMADGRHKPLADLEVGDSIYGTVWQGRYRRYARTTVAAKWVSVKPAFRVTLADGTELVASGDHRFLTDRGWKHVTNSGSGPHRAHLTLDNTLIGTGRFADQTRETADYRRGYLCGMIRGDGHLASYKYAHSDRTADVHRFRLALADIEALERAKRYLTSFGVATDEFLFSPVSSTCRAITAIRAQSRGNVERIHELIRWPNLPSLDWCRGFLGGIFDAEGSRSDFALRISNTDSEIVSWTTRCLRWLGLDMAYDRTTGRGGLMYVRVTGGLSQHLRFFHLADPAITRKRSIEGQMIKTFTDLRVVSIEHISRGMPLYDITTGTGDFIADGVVSHNCFARPTHRYLDFNPGRDFEREIVVKVNAPEVLRAELARPSWKGEHVALGTNTDPYQWVEGRYRLMEGIWEALRDAGGGAGNPCSVLTKSPLLLRDLPLMLQIAQRTTFGASLSIPTLDERAWRATEPHTPNPRARLEAVAELNRAGISTGVLIAPLMPGINDAPRQLEPLLQGAIDAGATSIGGVALHLRGEVRDVFMEWLRSERPDLVERYEDLYSRGAYAPREERERLAALVRRRRAGRETRRWSGLPSEPQDAPIEPHTPQERLF